MPVLAGGREDRERPHQPEGGGAGRLRGAVQDQETHAAEQADEGLLREAGASTRRRAPVPLRCAVARRQQPCPAAPGLRSWKRACVCVSVRASAHVCTPLGGCFLPPDDGSSALVSTAASHHVVFRWTRACVAMSFGCAGCRVVDTFLLAVAGTRP